MLTFFPDCVLFVAAFLIDSVEESGHVAEAAVTSPRPSASEKKSRITKKKTTKLTLPADEDEHVAESSQDDEPATNLSQDFFPDLSQKSSNNSNSNSVLLSSLSKNRFSLGNIPVAKLKKSSKNPFATSSPASPAKVQDKQPKKRGRPPKVKQ